MGGKSPQIPQGGTLKWQKKFQVISNYRFQLERLLRHHRLVLLLDSTPPAAVLIKKACNLKSGSGVPNKTKVAKITKAQVKEIAELKMPDLNAASVETAMSMIEGTCRSMGVTVVED